MPKPLLLKSACLNETRLIAVCLLTQTLALIHIASAYSPTLNEPAHLAAGVSHWRSGEFSLYRVNPPLIRMVAAIPVLFADAELRWSEPPHIASKNYSATMLGKDLIASNRERSYWLFTIARVACIPFCWLGALVCYKWSRDLYGPNAGLLACVLWCFSPDLLGHGSLITPDAHAAAIGATAGYTFWRWLNSPNCRTTGVAGVALGMAELAKATLLIFSLLWPLIWLTARLGKRNRVSAVRMCSEGAMVAAILLIGVYIVNLGYGFHGSLRPLGDFTFSSRVLSINTSDPLLSDQSYAAGNCFRGSVLEGVVSPLPEDYLLGIDTQQCDFEDYGRPSYLNGVWREPGWWYWYLAACVTKLPAGIFVIAGLACFRRSRGSATNRSQANDIVLLTPPLVIFLVVSLKYGFTEHSRYVFPCFPFLFIWISAACGRRSFARDDVTKNPESTDAVPAVFLSRAALISCCWFVSSSLWTYPHSISYVNELAGGPQPGWRRLIQSNYDWGQDLVYLRRWLESKPVDQPGEQLYLAYFGNVSPGDLGFIDSQPWPVQEDPNNTASAQTETVETPLDLKDGDYAISATLLAGYPWSPRSSEARGGRLPPKLLAILRDMEPIGRAGYSILIFDGSELRTQAKINGLSGD